MLKFHTISRKCLAGILNNTLIDPLFIEENLNAEIYEDILR